ncbi:MAG TPA: GFA family protein [Candidatus Binataceae bacterium]|nr:GFA family protein [Candidatus Binataceae bacterium]
MAITGGCACGAVRYECAADPMMAANCYCTDCRHSTGTAMASVMLVPKAALKITGTLKQYAVKGDSGAEVSRGFCPNCGSPILSLIGAMPEFVALKAGSLDDQSQFKPMVQVYMQSAPHWAPVRDDLPKFDKQPG